MPIRPFLADDHSFGPRRHRKNVCGIVTQVIKGGGGDRAPGADVTGVRRAFGLHQKCELTTARPAGGGGRNNSNEYSNEYAKSC